MDVQALASCFAGIVAIAVLAWYDPKRRPELRGSAIVRWLRMLLLAVLLAPGVVLIVQNRLATFIVWLGILCIAGWGVAHAAGLHRSR